MKKFQLLTLLLLCCTLLHAQDEAALIRAVKARLDQVNTYQATGTLTIDAAFIKAPASGITAYFKKPDQFAIKKGDGLSILPKGGISINFSTLLGNENSTAIGAGNAVVRGTPVRIVKLLPLDANSDVVLSTLYIDVKKELVHKAQVTTRNNGSYEVDLSYGRYATWGLPDKVIFTFNTREYKLPKGIAMEYDKGGTKKPAPPKDQKGVITVVYANYAINKPVDERVFN
ncbi:LolA family protein [Paracnuella aquatica]|uniref:LolA family protein n=1 Tax=Paracnuella aquatica TaxID=2268757 RepID=UPI000F500A56|nr:hypothetical protein [Paracnuella aquatica]RPD48236.1 hypothetical protein DRJ53_10845 [Paracnuella aquatica]